MIDLHVCSGQFVTLRPLNAENKCSQWQPLK